MRSREGRQDGAAAAVYRGRAGLYPGGTETAGTASVSDVTTDGGMSWLGVLGPLASALLPFARTISRKYRIQSNLYYCDLLRRQEELARLIVGEAGQRPRLRRKLEATLRDIGRELADLEQPDRGFALFIAFCAAELLAFSGVIMTGLLGLNALLLERSSVTGISFFEGALRYPAARILLFMAVVSGAVVALRRLARGWPFAWDVPWLRAAAFLALFNALLALGSIATLLILALTDPISPFW